MFKLVDDAGNISYDETTSFIVDKQAPVISSVSLANTNIEDGELNNLEAVLSSDLYTITATGYTSLESDIVATSPGCSGASYNTDIEKSNDTSLSAIQNYRICVRASDDAGNIATNSTNSFDRVDEGVYDNLVNTLRAGPSGDTIKGGLGGDTIIGSSGNDIIYPDLGASDSYITHLKNHSMVLWLDGSDPLGTGTPPSDGAHVATWYDKSKSNFDMPATSMPAYYSDGIGGRGAIRFDGVDDNYQIPYEATLNTTKQDVFVVAQIRGGLFFVHPSCQERQLKGITSTPPKTISGNYGLARDRCHGTMVSHR